MKKGSAKINKPRNNKTNSIIANNKKAFFNYTFEKQLEAGLVLAGWEVKSIRAHKVQLIDSYIIIKNNEAWILGALINPLISTCTHTDINPSRTRKVLLHRKEINNLIGLTKQKGYTLIPQKMYWQHNKVKLTIGLAKGKKTHDKRATEQERSWKLQKQRLLKYSA